MKKMNYIFNLMAGAVLLLSAYACSREEIDAPAPEKPVAKTEFRLGIADTKTSLGASEDSKRKVYWSNGDKVAINGIASDELSEVGEAVSSAVFTFDEAPVAPYNVIYPAGIYKDASTVTLPAYQTWKQGTFNDGMFPMAGYSATGLDATMDYLCATLRISILKDNGATPDEDNIRVVSFEGLGGERISGDFTIDYQTGTLTPVADPSDADKKVSVALNQSLSTDTALEVFIVVPAMNYASGFQITVQDSQGHIMTKTGYTTNGKELEAGKLYTLPEFRFIPSGEATGIEIWTAEDLIAFATAYNNKEYDALGSGLIATVMDDLTFDATTSAAFNATGGIGLKKDFHGSEDYYYGGTLNGNGKTISGLVATVPLFTATGSDGKIRNITIDNSCSFTFTHANNTEADLGSVVGYHKGLLSNVTVHADVALAAASVTKITALGGIVGREREGKVNGCTYDGAITVPTGFVSTSGEDEKFYVHIGGLVGYISNAEGVVTDSAFAGTIDFGGKVASTSTSDSYLRLGGIVGTNSGTVQNCTTAANNTLSAYNEETFGTIVNRSTKTYYMSEGGIVGYNAKTVTGCTNNAGILNFVLTTGDNNTASDSNSRYMNIGGIVGTNASGSSVTDSNNQAPIIHRSSPRLQRIGGIVGYNNGTVSGCQNKETGDLSIMTSGVSPYSARVLSYGGVIGEMLSSGSISNVQNAGDMTISRLENNANVYTFVGGVVGKSVVTIDGGTGKTISNSGLVSQSYTGATINATYGYNVGGIVGNTTQAISNVSNTGKVAYTKSSENGDANASAGGINVGGIVGSTSAAVANSTNAGEVTMVNSMATACVSTGGSNVGGIVGQGTASLSGCENSGYVHYEYNGGNVTVSTVRLGGIVGYLPLPPAVPVSVTGCTNKSASGNGGAVYIQATTKGYVDKAATGCEYYYLYMGGILGYAQNVAVSNCENQGYIHGGDGSGNINKANTVWAGGIVGYLSGASSISGCSHNGEVYNDHWSNRDYVNYDSPNAGGIAGHVVGASGKPITISSCEIGSSAKVRSRRGAVGGIVAFAQYATVTDCTVPIDMATSQSGYSYGGIVSAAKNSTITSCTFSGTTIQSSQMKVGGGIIGKLDSDTTIDGCTSYATTINKNGTAVPAGGIAGISVAGSTIQNCHYASAIGSICGDNNFSGENNTAD